MFSKTKANKTVKKSTTVKAFQLLLYFPFSLGIPHPKHTLTAFFFPHTLASLKAQIPGVYSPKTAHDLLKKIKERPEFQKDIGLVKNKRPGRREDKFRRTLEIRLHTFFFSIHILLLKETVFRLRFRSLAFLLPGVEFGVAEIHPSNTPLPPGFL